ncbi:MAG: NADP-dependent phosphogluconate dehydrogenase, partial [Candidatus Heimdallarchaeota archaeon]|nr:NADP-dependent phosphogluconate dehydrogenase [Candidatus Heimdallarchaeota archaeon]
MKLKQLGIIGFGTMGKNLALNFRDHGITVAVYETKKDVVQKFIVQNSDDGLTAFSQMAPFLENLRSPKIIILLVPAGAAVDELLDDLIDLLSPNDILIDSGNSYYKDSLNRHHRLDEVGIKYIDMGISGGGKGARHGPSMMVGADSKTWNIVKPIIQTITLSTEFKGLSGDLVGPPGSGHFVKMVHNGIEYGIMELISEVYHVARISSLTNIEIARMFDDWNDNRLNSYLIKISSSILKKLDSVNPSEYLIDKILDSAEQKGTGRWSSLEALSLGIANPIIQSAVEQRSIS